MYVSIITHILNIHKQIHKTIQIQRYEHKCVDRNLTTWPQKKIPKFSSKSNDFLSSGFGPHLQYHTSITTWGTGLNSNQETSRLPFFPAVSVGGSGKTQGPALNKDYWYIFSLEVCRAPYSTIKASQQVEFPALSKLISMYSAPKVYGVFNNRVLEWETKSISNNLCCFVYQWGLSHKLSV